MTRHGVQACKPSLDVQYYIFQRRQLLKADAESDSGGVTVALSKLESLKSECQAQWLEVVTCQVEFWAELCAPKPSVRRLTDIGTRLETLTRRTESNFEKQLELYPNSVQIMRRFAKFLLEVSALSHNCYNSGLQCQWRVCTPVTSRGCCFACSTVSEPQCAVAGLCVYRCPTTRLVPRHCWRRRMTSRTLHLRRRARASHTSSSWTRSVVSLLCCMPWLCALGTMANCT